MLIAWWLALAHAHPGASGPGGGPARMAIGHRSTLTIGDDTVRLDYVCEVPAITLYAEARRAGVTGDYVATKIGELSSGLQITWDGQALPLQDLDVGEPAKEGESGFIDLHVARQAKLPGHAGTVGLRNGNYPDEGAYFATEVSVAGDLVVAESSLAKVKDGRLKENRHGAWVKDESGREPTVRIRPAHWYEVADGQLPMPERMEGLVKPTPLAQGLLAALGLVGLVFMAWLGRTLGARARSLRQHHALAPAEPEARSPEPPAEGRP